MEKVFSNKKVKRFLGILLAVVIIFNIFTPNILTIKSNAAEFANGVGGILLLPLTALVALLAEVAQGIIDVAFEMTGQHMFIDTIVYNKVVAFRVNIFDQSNLSEGGKDALIKSMLPSIQKWYGYTRILAVAAAFVMLIYVAIQILLSTAAGDKAKYKQLLKDWVLSLLLIFTMHYIMAGILYICDALTEVFAASAPTIDPFGMLNNQILKLNATALLYAVLKWVFIILTLSMVIIYTKRVIMIAFLTIVAPLVAISYSVDKIKDGKSQILDKWMKEYVYNALTMPLDALLFTLIADVLSTQLGIIGGVYDPSNPTNIIFATALVVGYLPLRGWFTEFIGADKASHGMSGVAAGALLGNALGKMGSKDKKGSNGEKGSDDSGEETSNESVAKEKIASAGKPPESMNSGNLALQGDNESKTPEATSYNSNASGGSSSQSPRAAAARSLLGKVGKAYGKGLGAVAGLTAGAMVTAATGNVMTGAMAGKSLSKAANKGSEFGLAGKIGTKAVNTGRGVATTAQQFGSGVLAMKDSVVGKGRADEDISNDYYMKKDADGNGISTSIQEREDMYQDARDYIGESDMKAIEDEVGDIGEDPAKKFAVYKYAREKQIKENGGYSNYNYQNYVAPIRAEKAKKDQEKVIRKQGKAVANDFKKSSKKINSAE